MELQTARTRTAGTVTFGSGLIAGIGGGAVAGFINVALLLTLHARVPPAGAAGWSSAAAGALGGAVYWLWSRISPRPVAALWLTSLLAATLDSMIIIGLPFPAARVTPLAPLAGLVTPLLQILALFGIGGFSHHYAPPAAAALDTSLHYMTAIVVSLLVPPLARTR